MRAAARRQHNRSPKPRPRKIAQVQRYSDFEVIDGQDVASLEEMSSPRQRQRPEVGSTPSLYTIFQNILQVHIHVHVQYQEYIIRRERESILLHILLCKRVADN